MKHLLAPIALAALLPAAAFADVERLQAEGSVAEVADRLEASIKAAGASVFARVDHGAGAQAAGMELAEAQLLIFGNPKLGTPAMQDDMRAGLYLPLKMLVYAGEDGETQILWEEPEETFDDLDIDDDAAYIEKMEEALQRFATAAAGE
ncbi:DUF302 domain-containing protein [Salipiger sp. PrR002]|uniref:DUF302 domain-containing protein n=1 Tax=Salipiger sp. PrR002 TaxID=2706489 RepID=UPI0013B87C4F|nr:DUF302 domain-containing protein [Salipiger sp. PrR002]NDV99552.1 DUF302 domain-containing protein [Salipiger sp. PrR002]NDW57198.1 DUF302 domain-containing protein [Salipiger sp. PrR004]